MSPKNRRPTHPGEVLLEEFLIPMSMTQVELAAQLGVPVQRINTIINGKRSVSAETAILLAGVFKTSPHFWMNLQISFDLYDAQLRLNRAA
ncbi:MAG: HigA family addiction module antidote protein [Ignavibacteria bacterium]|nr:HigA family addiction module antidote protein [Ignavibacteria bacterium]MBK6419737.1 HigA family addiction module antidote protein [Ignavibacteria bacterium]MBK7413324.1 HigA family addiction module antidote protein [Ignavibacteria bacterium]